MREFKCKYCERVIGEGEFEGKYVVHCPRCKSRNIIQSLAGSYMVTVSVDRRPERRPNKFPLPVRAVVE